MPSCSIKWCGKNSGTSSYKKDGITFHRFPSNPNFKNKWIDETKRENWFPAANSVICSRHFTEDCFFKIKNRRRLLSTAVPTLYLPLLSNHDIHKEAPSTGPSNAENPSKKAALGKRFPSIPPKYETPLKKQMFRRIIELSNIVKEKNKKIKNLLEKNRYISKKLKKVLNNLEKEKLVNSCKCNQ